MKDPASQSVAPDVKALLDGPPGHVHLVGVGGVGMAGLALLFKAAGWNVSGCDKYAGPLYPWLAEKDVPAAVGHDPRHLDPRPDLVVRTPAVPMTDAELAAARKLGIPVADRGAVFPVFVNRYRLVAVSGTHGKTTTASMLAWILRCAGIEVSHCIGGDNPDLGGVAAVRPSGIMVVEADESDGTLVHYRPEIAVVTSMDLDHVDYFASEETHASVYRTFTRGAETVIYPAFDAAASALFDGDSRAVGFSADEGADAPAAAHVRSMEGSGTDCSFRLPGLPPFDVRLSVPGRHNVLNALAAAAAAAKLGADPGAIAGALSRFALPRRRFETVAEKGGIRVISDYAHHPVEIDALRRQADLLGARRIIAVFQPHRYTRTRAFLREFAAVLARFPRLILLPVYPAFESYIAEGTSDALLAEIRQAGRGGAELAASVEEGWNMIRDEWRPGDLVLLIGAGNLDVIGPWAKEELERIYE